MPTTQGLVPFLPLARMSPPTNTNASLKPLSTSTASAASAAAPSNMPSRLSAALALLSAIVLVVTSINTCESSTRLRRSCSRTGSGFLGLAVPKSHSPCKDAVVSAQTPWVVSESSRPRASSVAALGLTCIGPLPAPWFTLLISEVGT